MSLLKPKRDRGGQSIFPGDVCVYGSGFVVFKKPSWGGPDSKGLYGQFLFSDGSQRSIRYSSVLFAFDPLGKRRNTSQEVKAVTKAFYG